MHNTFPVWMLTLLGLVFTVSHVCSIPFGLNMKAPEILICFMILYCCVRPPRFPWSTCWPLAFALFLVLIVSPLISNLLSLFNIEDLEVGAAKLGLSKGGRSSPYFGPWFMLCWHVFNLVSFFIFATVSKEEFGRFVRSIVISIFIMNLYTLYHSLGVQVRGWPDFPWPSDTRHGYGQLRALGFFIEPLNLAHFLIYGLPLILIPEARFSSGARNFIFTKLNFGLSCLCFLLTFSTTGLFAMVVALVVALLIAGKMTAKRLGRGVLMFSLFFAVIFEVPKARTFFIDKIVMSVTSPQTVGPTLLDRLFKMEVSWGAFKRHPVLGNGVGTAGFYYPEMAPPEAYDIYDNLPLPLNEYLRLLAEQGVVGLVLFLIFAVLYLNFLRRARAYLSTSHVILFLGGFVATLIAFNFSNFFHIYYIWVFMGLSLAYIRIHKEASTAKDDNNRNSSSVSVPPNVP